MKFQKQLFRHRPDEDIYGDCQRTVIACFLDLPASEVPNFGHGAPEGPEFNARIDEWLSARGLDRIKIVFNGDTPLRSVLDTMKNTNPGMYYCLAGLSATGVNHIVIGLDDRIEWDTSINNSGIVGPCDDGYWWIEFFVPLFTRAQLK